MRLGGQCRDLLHRGICGGSGGRASMSVSYVISVIIAGYGEQLAMEGPYPECCTVW